MAKLVRIEKPGGGWALGRRNGKLITDAGGAPCCCGGTSVGCGVPSPLCATLRGGMEACGAEFNLGGRYKVDIRIDRFEWAWSQDRATYTRTGSFPNWRYNFVRTIGNASGSLANPVLWSYTIGYCPETANWIACVNGPGLNRFDVPVFYQWEGDSCAVNNRPTLTECTPSMSGANYDSGSGTYFLQSTGINRSASGFRFLAPASCLNPDASGTYRRDGAFAADPAWSGWASPLPVAETSGFDNNNSILRLCLDLAYRYENSAGFGPYKFDPGPVPTGDSGIPTNLNFPIGGFVASDPGDDGSATLSGSQSVNENRTAGSLAKTYVLDFTHTYLNDGGWASGNSISATREEKSMSAQAECSIAFTRLDDCGQAPPLPPGLDENGQPAKQPGQCAGCGN